MSSPPRPREIRRADFDARDRASGRPPSAQPLAAPAWAKHTDQVATWRPETEDTPSTPDAEEAAPRAADSAPSVGRAPTTKMQQRPAPIFEPEPEPEPREPTIPPGMILISREELVERESEIRDEYRKHYLASATRLREAIGELETRLREDVVDLAARIATVLVQRAIEQDRNITLDIARRTLRRLGPVERIIVKCAESDADLLRERLSVVASTEMGQPVEVLVRPSIDIDAGGLVVTFDGGVVDAREDKRLARIVEAVKAAVRESDALLESARVRARTTQPADGEGRPAPRPAGDDARSGVRGDEDER